MSDNAKTNAPEMSVVSALDYPFNPKTIMQKKLSIKKALVTASPNLMKKRIAILGGSTTSEIINILELFLLKAGIQAEFYESDFGKYYEDIMFNQEALKEFNPDIIFFHTSFKNLESLPTPGQSQDDVEVLKQQVLTRYRSMWEKAKNSFQCPIIQNNFEFPLYRPMGNLDSVVHYGRTQFIMQLNQEFAKYAQENQNFQINDIFYLSSKLGLETWYDDRFWYAYKYALSYQCIPHFAHGLAKIIGAHFGLSKKCLVLDLDNTLWGGIIGDDGMNGIQIGKETPQGEAYTAFQEYIQELSRRGVILAVCSKNEEENALEGFKHPDSILKAEDFADFKANWDLKSINIPQIAKAINIGIDSLVFIDDNPAERNIVRSQVGAVTVPECGKEPQTFMRALDGGLFFETIALSDSDLKRQEQYTQNRSRQQAEAQFEDYDSFLRSLEMEASIDNFSPVYMDRITQLINKTNQFNLTTKRRTLAEVEEIVENSNFIHLYGRLKDKFGDNGLITVLIALCEGQDLHIDTWLMSCRVFKRGMEIAMFNALMEQAKERGIKRVFGYYSPTKKNGLVAELFKDLGFTKESQGEDNSSTWVFNLENNLKPMAHTILVTRKES